MNRQLLAERVAGRLGVSNREGAAAVEAVLDAIVRAVVAGHRVSVTGFGSFDSVDRMSRAARNPQTGELVQVPEKVVPCFRAGQAFKDLVNGDSALPPVGDSSIKKAPKGSLAAKAAQEASKKSKKNKKAGGKLGKKAKGKKATKAPAKNTGSKK